MKVVHIADSTDGGASRATLRLDASLQRLGLDSRLLVRKDARLVGGVATIATRGENEPFFPIVRDTVLRHYVELNRTSGTNTHFSLYIDGADASQLPLVASSDIVHLHWTASFQTPDDIRALLETKPVVWTLHDLGPLTGGCHFPSGCEKFVDNCEGCPQLNHDPFEITARTLRDKHDAWANHHITFIAPSQYMAELAQRSAIVQRTGSRVVHVPNGIDVSVFAPLSKPLARKRAGLHPEGLYVLCGSFHNSETRKGLRLVSRIMHAVKGQLDPGSLQLKLLTVGEPSLDVDDLCGIDVVQLGRVPDNDMASLYAAADVFLVPSVEDNFPSMVLESLSCGTPAIAFDAGGAPELIREGYCGHVVPVGDEEAMAAALSALLGDGDRRSRMSALSRAHIEEHFCDGVVARAHADLYAEILESDVTVATTSARRSRSSVAEILPTLRTACLAHEVSAMREQFQDGKRQSERDIETLRSALSDHHAQLEAKQSELEAAYEVAAERKVLAETLESLAVRLRSAIGEGEDACASLHATVDRQAAEITLVHQVAAERQALIDEQSAEITLVHHVAAERQELVERLHQEAGKRTREDDRPARLVRKLRRRWSLFVRRALLLFHP